MWLASSSEKRGNIPIEYIVYIRINHFVLFCIYFIFFSFRFIDKIPVKIHCDKNPVVSSIHRWMNRYIEFLVLHYCSLNGFYWLYSSNGGFISLFASRFSTYNTVSNHIHIPLNTLESRPNWLKLRPFAFLHFDFNETISAR